MKKSILFLFSCLIVILGTSCSSIPKKANVDSSIVVGEVSIYFPEDNYYAADYQSRASGTIRRDIEVVLEEIASQRQYKAKTDKEGFFVFKNLKPNVAYKLVKVSFQKEGSASIVTRWINLKNYTPFVPVAGSVTNLGVVQYTWQDDRIYTKYYPNTIVHARFEEVAEESEWLSKPIVDIFDY